VGEGVVVFCWFGGYAESFGLGQFLGECEERGGGGVGCFVGAASLDRPGSRTRSKATPAVDEVADATPIAPAASNPPPGSSTSGVFAPLNAGNTLDVQGDVDYLMAHQCLNKVNAVSDAIRKYAADLRAIEGRRSVSG